MQSNVTIEDIYFGHPILFVKIFLVIKYPPHCKSYSDYGINDKKV